MIGLAKAGFLAAVALYAVAAFIGWGWPAIGEWEAGERFFVFIVWVAFTALVAG